MTAPNNVPAAAEEGPTYDAAIADLVLGEMAVAILAAVFMRWATRWIRGCWNTEVAYIRLPTDAWFVPHWYLMAQAVYSLLCPYCNCLLQLEPHNCLVYSIRQSTVLYRILDSFICKNQRPQHVYTLICTLSLTKLNRIHHSNSYEPGFALRSCLRDKIAIGSHLLHIDIFLESLHCYPWTHPEICLLDYTMLCVVQNTWIANHFIATHCCEALSL